MFPRTDATLVVMRAPFGVRHITFTNLWSIRRRPSD